MWYPNQYRVQYYNNPNLPSLSPEKAYQCLTEDERIKILLESNSLIGELFSARPLLNKLDIDEPARYVTVDPMNAAFVTRGFEMVDGNLWFEIQILPTPRGKILEDALVAYDAVKTMQEPTWNVLFCGRFVTCREPVGEYKLITIDAIMSNRNDVMKE